MIEKKELQKIKKQLPRGYSKLASEKTGKSRAYVSHVLNGRLKDLGVINVLIELARKHATDQKNVLAKIKELEDISSS